MRTTTIKIVAGRDQTVASALRKTDVMRKMHDYTLSCMSSLPLTYNDILVLLSIVAVAMLIIVLYNLIFASVALRRISGRMDELSKDVEAIILKPIGAVDFILDWFLSVVDSMRSDKKTTKKGKHHDVMDVE